jgi:3D (Asp-Asp-Asp) domain-containing protein
MNKSLIIRSIIIGAISGIVLYGIAVPKTINADLKNSNVELSSSTLIHNGHLTFCKLDKSSFEVVKTIKGLVTAYSSTVGQTDDRPFEAASGRTVYDGMVANNKLPFGTKIRIPQLYGDKILTVDDRMHKRKWDNQFDVWYDSFSEAKAVGARYGVVIEVLES